MTTGRLPLHQSWHEQDVALLDEDKIVQTMKDKMQYKLEPKYKDGKLVGYILVIYDMTPDELMDKLAFVNQQRDWAALMPGTRLQTAITLRRSVPRTTPQTKICPILYSPDAKIPKMSCISASMTAAGEVRCTAAPTRLRAQAADRVRLLSVFPR